MNCIDAIKSSFFSFLQTAYSLNALQLDRCNFDINTDPDKQQFGDLNSNAAMVLAKDLKTNPRTIAQHVIDNFTHEFVGKIEIAGPGFLNFYLTDQAYLQLAEAIFTQDKNFFKPAITPQKINVEFVSANPTGPLHFGHGRNGIIGDSVAHVLAFLGHDVTREFYINDAGEQIRKLGESLKIRCRQHLGETIELPEDAYHGQYLVHLAEKLIELYGKNILEKPMAFFEQYGQDTMLAHQKEVLEKYGIKFDIWFSEKALKDTVNLEDYIAKLHEKGYVYEEDGALWFKTTAFGDDKDRVLKKSDGQYTYLAGDLPYLVNKLERGFDKLIMVLGHDHHSFVLRLHALMQALGYEASRLSVILYQLVHVIKDGKQARMSKRAGRIVSLEDIIEATSKDVSRFFYLNRKADAELEFDVDLALKQSNENPVYYMQYAYVRTNSILKKATEANSALTQIAKEDYTQLVEDEKVILKKICSLKSLLETINNTYQTHLLAYYTSELASLFHTYYNQVKAIHPDDIAYSKNRLFIIHIVKNTFNLCFNLMGINSPKQM